MGCLIQFNLLVFMLWLHLNQKMIFAIKLYLKFSHFLQYSILSFIKTLVLNKSSEESCNFLGYNSNCVLYNFQYIIYTIKDLIDLAKFRCTIICTSMTSRIATITMMFFLSS